MQNRFKNYGLWVSIGSLIIMILNDAYGISPDQVKPYIDIVLTIAIAAGIISNPSNGKGFKDKNKNI